MRPPNILSKKNAASRDGDITKTGKFPGILKPGGAEGSRTPDLIRARDALSHLSYCPTDLQSGLCFGKAENRIAFLPLFLIFKNFDALIPLHNASFNAGRP